MTLIAFATRRDAAEVLVDTGTYSLTGRYLSKTTKTFTVPHLDMVVAEQGGTAFAHHWRHQLGSIHRDGVQDFDALHETTPGRLSDLWASMESAREEENTQSGGSASLPASCLFHVGYSAGRGRFVAYGYSSDFDFEPLDLSDGHVMPAPKGTRLSTLERVHLQRSLDGITGDDEEARQAATAYLDRLSADPVFVAPTSRRGWVELAERVRRSRALAHIASGIKTPVSGDVWLTSLRRGETNQRKVHTYRDTGDELRALVAGTLHPLAQRDTCPWCESGKRYVDCCLTEHNGQPCPCQSGRTFDSCCSVRTAHTPSPPNPPRETP